jgi:hypothetical protein
LKTLRAVKAYLDSRCISFTYDLDDDGTIEVIEYRRWTNHGNLSAPIRVFYNKNGDIEISCDEVARWKDPLPEAGLRPPRMKKRMDEV